MAEKKRVKVGLQSTASSHAYMTTKNRKRTPHKLELKKYDPLVRRHVLYRETK